MLRASHPMLALTLAASLASFACNGDNPVAPVPSETPTSADVELESDMPSDIEVEPDADADAGGGLPSDVLDAFERSDGPLRVVVSGRADLDDPAAVERATRQLSQAARTAGIASVDPIEGEPTLVLRASRQQLEALWATGLVERIHIDQARPPL